MDVVEASMAAVEFERFSRPGDCSRPFRIDSEFKPTGDQPGAIKKLCEDLEVELSDLTLLGVLAHLINKGGESDSSII